MRNEIILTKFKICPFEYLNVSLRTANRTKFNVITVFHGYQTEQNNCIELSKNFSVKKNAWAAPRNAIKEATKAMVVSSVNPIISAKRYGKCGFRS